MVFILSFSLIGVVIFRSFAANPNLPGDINGDNTVNITDLSILLSNYNTANSQSDLNGDSVVTILDLSILLSNYGRTYTPAPVVNISASPTVVAPGGSAVLTWSSTNSTSCTASGAWTGAKALSGSQTVTPAATSTYSLSCTGSAGTTIKSITVTVNTGTGPGSGGSGGTIGLRSNWPCTGCATNVPSTYVQSKPTVLLVALHGDEGNSSLAESYWQPTTDKYNVILFAPQCPAASGCTQTNSDGSITHSWWGWLQSSPTYDDNWIGAQVSAIESAYNIDKTKEYLTGWSGGADYLGWYALRHGDRFAAADFVAGGVPYVQSCPAKNMAAYFLMGSNDFRYLSGQPSQVKQVYDNCAHQTVLTLLPGADHTTTINALVNQGYADIIMQWFLQHPLTPYP
jgi:pimeloyl-ACP methyl ester carboxylesterase